MIKVFVLVVFMAVWYAVGYVIKSEFNDMSHYYVMLIGWILCLIFTPIFNNLLFGED
jgi:hypothetical protein